MRKFFRKFLGILNDYELYGKGRAYAKRICTGNMPNDERAMAFNHCHAQPDTDAYYKGMKDGFREMGITDTIDWC